jgi:DNA-binding response OmpR family regulator
MVNGGVTGTVRQSARCPQGAVKHRVLVVDDNRDLAMSSSWLLKYEGHEVEVAFDGLQALEVARAFRPDVVILDVGLPGLDGYEVARRLRAEFGRDVVVIIITAYADDQGRKAACEAHFDHFFTKPINFTAITSMLA